MLGWLKAAASCRTPKRFAPAISSGQNPTRNEMAKTFLGRQLGSKLRIAEKTFLAFFAALCIAFLTVSLPSATLGVLAVLNVIVGCLIVALSKDDLAERSWMALPVRDWLPAFVMLLAYRESGLFIKADPAQRSPRRRWPSAPTGHASAFSSASPR